MTQPVPPEAKMLCAVLAVWRGKTGSECEPGAWKASAHPRGVLLERLPRRPIAANDDPSMPDLIA